MKGKSLFLLPSLIAVVNFMSVNRLTAQIFTAIRSFGILTNITGFFPQSTPVQGPDGTLYGTASGGEGIVNSGTIFKVQPDGSGFRALKLFTNYVDGEDPVGALAFSNGVLYGTTSYGGSSYLGTVFKVNVDGTGFAVLKSFTGGDGANPYYAGLSLSGNVIYGATLYGGSSNSGVLFRLNTDGSSYTVLKDFTDFPDGANPNADLAVSGSVLYGTTENGGSSGVGTLFKLNTDGTAYTILKIFSALANDTNSDGAYPDGVLTLVADTLYGTTYRGGSLGYGTVFQVNTDGTGFTVLKNFAGIDGANPAGRLPLSGGVLYGTTASGGSSNYGTVFQVNTDGTGHTVLKNLIYSDGAIPYGGVTLSANMLYGSASLGGTSGAGTLFKLNTDGTGYSVVKNCEFSDLGGSQASLTVSGGVLYGAAGGVFKMNTDGTGYTTLKRFTVNGSVPGDLVLSDGVLYGTTLFGGSSGWGTLYRINTDGTGFAVRKDFDGNTSDGGGPHGGLVLLGNVLYGTTQSGGSAYGGTVYQVNTDGTGYAVLKNFDVNNSDGADPAAGLTLSGNELYGTTGGYYGASPDYGRVFKMNTDGTGYTLLKTLTGAADGADPRAAVIVSGGVVYGTTTSGGSSGNGTVFKVNTDGTGFTVLKDFSSSDGGSPQASVTLVGTTLYGTTDYGGGSHAGTVFKVNTDGTGYAVIKTFTNTPDGSTPFGGLTLVGNALYGTTVGGGTLGEGTVFSLSFPPQLTITPAGANVILSWPTNAGGFDYTGYTLQSTTNILSPAAWITNSPAPVIINGQNTVTNLISGSQKFYRLIQ